MKKKTSKTKAQLIKQHLSGDSKIIAKATNAQIVGSITAMYLGMQRLTQGDQVSPVDLYVISEAKSLLREVMPRVKRAMLIQKRDGEKIIRDHLKAAVKKLLVKKL